MTISQTVKRFSPPLYRLRIFVIIVAALAAPFTVYYLFYVRSQSGYFTDRNFRKLASTSAQIGAKVENAALVFKNTSDRFIRPGITGTVTFNPDASRKDNLEPLKEVFKFLKGERQIIPLSIDTEPLSDKVSPGTVTLNTIRQEGDSSWLYLDYVSEGVREKTVIRVQGKLDLNRLIQPFLSARVGSDYDRFQNILITESETGRVIFQYDTTEMRLASLDKLPSSEGQGKKIELKDVAQTSNVVDVALAGSNYRLFSHPLKLSLPCSNAHSPNLNWITSGLIKSNYFQTEAWSLSVPYTILIIGGFLLALLFFNWPFLKLVLAGPKDRFRPRDVYFLVFSTIVVLAVLTCFGLYAYVYTSVESEMDGQVKTLASEIKTNFNDELTRALDQLNKLRNNSEIIKELEAKNKEQKSGVNTKETDIYQRGETNKTNILPALLRSSQTTYNYFDSAAWMDESGMQKAKWSIKTYNTQYITVTGRDYFDNIQKKRFYRLGTHEFWLEPLISRNTGRNQVEISMAVPDEKWIVAFDMRLISLMDPVLPAGYGYAIIDKDGKVVFHSDEAHHLGENLFQECDENPELLAGLVGRSNKTLDVRYLGEDHTFFITPLERFPHWTLVTFRNKQPLRSVFLELLTSITILFLIYGFVIMASFTIFYIFNVVNERRAWLWPCETKGAIYVQSIVLLLALSVVSLALTVLLHGQKLVWSSVAIGLFAGLAYFMNLRWGLNSPFLKYFSSLLKHFKRHNRLYVVNASLILLLVSILPAAAFFKYAYESQITLFIKHAQYSMATALATREGRIRNQYSNIKFIDREGSDQSKAEQKKLDDLEQKERAKFVRDRLAVSWDVYNNFFFGTTDEKPNADTMSGFEVCQTDFLAKLSAILPPSNRASIERRGLLENTSVAGMGKWELGSNGRLILHPEGAPGPQAVHLNTSVPLLGVPKFGAIPLVVLIVPFFLFVNYLIRKVFVLDVQKPASHSLKKLLSEKINRNAFVVVNAPFVKKVPGNGSNLYLKALPSIATSSDWADTFDYASSDDRAVIALDQFDYKIDDTQLNQQKLKLMENLLAKERKLLIFSSVEFSEYRFSNGENGNGHANGTSDEAGRRAEMVISDFFTEYAEDTDDGSKFKKKINRQKARIVAQGVKGRSVTEINELFDTLYFECARREPLQRVGLKILSLKGFVDLNRKQLIGIIVNQARAYYTYLWNSCSPSERQTLGHLAQDGLVSHRDPDIEPLLRRELIVREHDLHLFNASFRHFVKSADHVSFVVEQDKQTQQGSLWQTLKVPILIAMLGITVFIFLTQQDLYSRSLALLTGITTLIPALFKVLAMFQGEPASRPPTQA